MKKDIDHKILGQKIKEAVATRIQLFNLIDEIRQLIIKDDAPESEQMMVESTVGEFVDDWAGGSETADGFGVEDAKALLEELSDER